MCSDFSRLYTFVHFLVSSEPKSLEIVNIISSQADVSIESRPSSFERLSARSYKIALGWICFNKWRLALRALDNKGIQVGNADEIASENDFQRDFGEFDPQS